MGRGGGEGKGRGEGEGVTMVGLGRFSGIYFKAPRKGTEHPPVAFRHNEDEMRYATARLKKERSEYLKARQSFI